MSTSISVTPGVLFGILPSHLVLDTDGEISVSAIPIHGTIPITGTTRTTIILTLTGTGIILIGEVMGMTTITGTGMMEITGIVIMDREGPLLPPMEKKTHGPPPLTITHG
jgi:hypothetical protein